MYSTEWSLVGVREDSVKRSGGARGMCLSQPLDVKLVQKRLAGRVCQGSQTGQGEPAAMDRMRNRAAPAEPWRRRSNRYPAQGCPGCSNGNSEILHLVHVYRCSTALTALTALPHYCTTAQGGEKCSIASNWRRMPTSRHPNRHLGVPRVRLRFREAGQIRRDKLFFDRCLGASTDCVCWSQPTSEGLDEASWMLKTA